MTTNVFLVWAPELTVPLTIYAQTADEARETFALWCAIHQPRWTRVPQRLEEVTEEWLRDRPQLAQAIERARRHSMNDAVLWFHSNEGGWFAIDVHEQMNVGAIAPIEPRVRAFEIKSQIEDMEGVEVMVFAFSPEDAAQMYLDYRETFFGPVEHPFTINEFSRWLLTGGQTHLRDLMEMGVTGIAGWSPASGWGIFPPTHELAGE